MHAGQYSDAAEKSTAACAQHDSEGRAVHAHTCCGSSCCSGRQAASCCQLAKGATSLCLLITQHSYIDPRIQHTTLTATIHMKACSLMASYTSLAQIRNVTVCSSSSMSVRGHKIL